MFKYKICKTCKWYHRQLAIFIGLALLVIWMMPSEETDLSLFITLSAMIAPSILFTILHFREHQRKQFEKIKNKFGVN